MKRIVAKLGFKKSLEGLSFETPACQDFRACLREFVNIQDALTFQLQPLNSSVFRLPKGDQIYHNECQSLATGTFTHNS